MPALAIPTPASQRPFCAVLGGQRMDLMPPVPLLVSGAGLARFRDA